MQANRVAVAANATLLSMLRLLAAAASARPPWYDGTLSRLNSSTHLGPRETTPSWTQHGSVAVRRVT